MWNGYVGFTCVNAQPRATKSERRSNGSTAKADGTSLCPNEEKNGYGRNWAKNQAQDHGSIG